MATVKLATLAIRTIAKPISNRLKVEARQHPFFRRVCVGIAQRMHRSEMRLATALLGQTPPTIKPLSETRAIDNGANFLAESFLFTVAASLILAESWRSSSKESKRREGVADQLEELTNQVQTLTEDFTRLSAEFDERWNEQKARNDELAHILQTIVEIGLRGGWVEFQDTPLRVPEIQLTPEVREPPTSPRDHRGHQLESEIRSKESNT